MSVVWCGVVWCGVWCGVVWCGVVWCGVVRCGAVCGVVIVVWCGVVWCCVVVPLIVVWCSAVWCGAGVGFHDAGSRADRGMIVPSTKQENGTDGTGAAIPLVGHVFLHSGHTGAHFSLLSWEYAILSTLSQYLSLNLSVYGLGIGFCFWFSHLLCLPYMYL
jgi:hypothetical protein